MYNDNALIYTYIYEVNISQLVIYAHTRDPKNVNNPVYSGHWSHWDERGEFRRGLG